MKARIRTASYLGSMLYLLILILISTEYGTTDIFIAIDQNNDDWLYILL